jgi:hypothetical protein
MKLRSAFTSLALLAAACSHQPVGAQLLLGTTTHFSQGWPPRYYDVARDAPVQIVRDSIHWTQAEKAPGQVDLSDRVAGHVPRLCAAGKRVLLDIDPRNRIHDSGLTANSVQSRTAFARFLRAIADRFGDCLIGFEIGNEINAGSNMTGPAGANRAASHAALLETVWREVKPAHPKILILGGSAHSVATGFLEDLFAAGALPFMDGVVIHPYRKDPTNLDWELDRLQAAMRRHGRPVPIWATEFGGDFPDRSKAPSYLLKMVSQMAAGHVGGAFWYALVDQPGFPNMGLYDREGMAKPAVPALALARVLTRSGPAIRNEGASGLYDYRFARGERVMWGLPRPVQIGAAAVRDATGREIPVPQWIGDEPIVVPSGATVQVGTSPVLADSLYQYARAPWMYRLVRLSGAPVPLAVVDWKWASYLGSPLMRAFAVNQQGLVLTSLAMIELAYQVERSGELYASWCLAPSTKPVSFALQVNGRTVQPGVTVAGASSNAVALRARAGDLVQFQVSAPAPVGPRSTGYRFRVATSPDFQATC